MASYGHISKKITRRSVTRIYLYTKLVYNRKMSQPTSLSHYLHEKAPGIRFDQLSHQHNIVCANIQQTQLYTDWLKQQNQAIKCQIYPKVQSLNQWLEQQYLNQTEQHHKIITYNLQLVTWHQIIQAHIGDIIANQTWQRAEQYHHYRQHECQFNHQNHNARSRVSELSTALSRAPVGTTMDRPRNP